MCILKMKLQIIGFMEVMEADFNFYICLNCTTPIRMPVLATFYRFSFSCTFWLIIQAYRLLFYFLKYKLFLLPRISQFPQFQLFQFNAVQSNWLLL